MILCKEEILAKMEEGQIVIEPYDPRLVNMNSVNVRLGADLWELNDNSIYVRDIYSTVNNKRYDLWKKISPVKASFVRIEYNKYWATDGDTVIIPDDADVFLLHPRKFYLATTLESIGTTGRGMDYASLIPKMYARSSFGRFGLTVARCAGLGDVGYHSRWALEVQVDGSSIVPIAIGTPIGQVVFMAGTPTKEVYGGASNYQTDDGVRFLPKGLGWIDPNE